MNSDMNETVEADKLKHSCENHQKCMEMIQAVLDGSATADEMEHFKTNMSECMPCIEGYELENSIKEALKMKVEKKCCPQSVVHKIKSNLGIALVLVGMVFIEIKLFHLIF